MPAWTIAIIATSVVVTAALTWVLMRINAPPPAPGQRVAGGDGGPYVHGGSDGDQNHSHHAHDHDGGGGDGGAGDGGGD